MSGGWQDALAEGLAAGIQGFGYERDLRRQRQLQLEEERRKQLMAQELMQQQRAQQAAGNKALLEMMGEALPSDINALADISSADLRLLSTDKKEKRKEEGKSKASNALKTLLSEEDQAALAGQDFGAIDPQVMKALIEGNRNRTSKSDLQEDRQEYGYDMLAKRLDNQKEMAGIRYNNSANLKRLGASLRPAKGGGRRSRSGRGGQASPAVNFSFNVKPVR